MEAVVINRKKDENNTPKLKYKLKSSEAIALYIAIYIILFLICKLVCFIPGSTWKFSVWYPVIVPYISIIVFTILLSTKLVLTNTLDLFKKYVILIETITIFRMWYGTYSMLFIKNSSGEFIKDDILAIIFLVLQLIIMGISLFILKYRAKNLDQ